MEAILKAREPQIGLILRKREPKNLAYSIDPLETVLTPIDQFHTRTHLKTPVLARPKSRWTSDTQIAAADPSTTWQSFDFPDKPEPHERLSKSYFTRHITPIEAVVR